MFVMRIAIFRLSEYVNCRNLGPENNFCYLPSFMLGQFSVLNVRRDEMLC